MVLLCRWLLWDIHYHLCHQGFVFLKHLLCEPKHRYLGGMHILKDFITFEFQTNYKILDLRVHWRVEVKCKYNVAKRSSTCFKKRLDWKVSLMCHAMDTYHEGCIFFDKLHYNIRFLTFEGRNPNVPKCDQFLLNLLVGYNNISTNNTHNDNNKIIWCSILNSSLQTKVYWDAFPSSYYVPMDINTWLTIKQNDLITREIKNMWTLHDLLSFVHQHTFYNLYHHPSMSLQWWCELFFSFKVSTTHTFV